MDLAAAGIPKTDAQARTVDVHGLRHTFATLLARNGVSPGVAQKLMRHSDIRLTVNTCTHLDLADAAGAVAALPGISAGSARADSACQGCTMPCSPACEAKTLLLPTGRPGASESGQRT